MGNKSWRQNNILNRYKERFFDGTLNYINGIENKVKNAIKSNSNNLAELFYERIADYLWDNYDIDELDDSKLKDIVYTWFTDRYGE